MLKSLENAQNYQNINALLCDQYCQIFGQIARKRAISSKVTGNSDVIIMIYFLYRVIVCICAKVVLALSITFLKQILAPFGINFSKYDTTDYKKVHSYLYVRSAF